MARGFGSNSARVRRAARDLRRTLFRKAAVFLGFAFAFDDRAVVGSSQCLSIRLSRAHVAGVLMAMVTASPLELSTRVRRYWVYTTHEAKHFHVSVNLLRFSAFGYSRRHTWFWYVTLPGDARARLRLSRRGGCALATVTLILRFLSSPDGARGEVFYPSLLFTLSTVMALLHRYLEVFPRLLRGGNLPLGIWESGRARLSGIWASVTLSFMDSFREYDDALTRQSGTLQVSRRPRRWSPCRAE